MTIPVFITMHDLVTWPKAMAEWIDQIPEIRPIFVDNASTYPPLLDYYKTCPFEVIKISENLGYQSVWIANLIEPRTDDLYIVTDPDLDLSGVPKDFVNYLKDGLAAHPIVAKVGFSLEINDIPEGTVFPNWVFEDQKTFWETPLGDGWYDAPIDTTFALYSNQRGFPSCPWPFLRAHRAVRPYTARHLPFYLTPTNIPEEYKYYIEHSSDAASSAIYFLGVI